MPKVKVHRTTPSLDMTPMVDLAFLLVTFFMLTTKFRPQETVIVDPPSSTSEIKLPETDVAVLTIANDGRVLYNLVGQITREKLLGKLGQKYGIQFSEEETKTFALMDEVGMPINTLKSYLAMTPEQRKNVEIPGIPIDSLNNELGEWILQTRLSNIKVVFAIKGDQDAQYPIVGKIISTLQDRKVNRFSLITAMEAKPTVASLQ